MRCAGRRGLLEQEHRASLGSLVTSYLLDSLVLVVVLIYDPDTQWAVSPLSFFVLLRNPLKIDQQKNGHRFSPCSFLVCVIYAPFMVD